jgi:hypothetical protein
LRDLEAKYPKEKAQKLAALLKSRGLWHWDPDFPNDEEEWSSEINTLYLNIRINLVHLKPYSAIKPSLQDGIVYCDPIQHFITF